MSFFSIRCGPAWGGFCDCRYFIGVVGPPEGTHSPPLRSPPHIEVQHSRRRLGVSPSKTCLLAKHAEPKSVSHNVRSELSKSMRFWMPRGNLCEPPAVFVCTPMARSIDVSSPDPWAKQATMLLILEGKATGSSELHVPELLASMFRRRLPFGLLKTLSVDRRPSSSHGIQPPEADIGQRRAPRLLPPPRERPQAPGGREGRPRGEGGRGRGCGYGCGCGRAGGGGKNLVVAVFAAMLLLPRGVRAYLRVGPVLVWPLRLYPRAVGTAAE